MNAPKQAPTVPQPTAFKVRKQSRVMEVSFDDGKEFSLPFELMRVYSPSAEVRGHAPGQAVLQLDKQDVEIVALEPVGNYGVKPSFSDGHDSGIYTWDYLYELGRDQKAMWADYLKRVEAANYAKKEPVRDPRAGLLADFHSDSGQHCGHKH
jgi:DUF971 family protein